MSKARLISLLCLALTLAGCTGLPVAIAPTPTATPLPPTATPLPPTVTPTVTSVPTLTPLPTATVIPTPDPATLSMNAEYDIGYVPILMYHYVREVDAEEDPLGYRLSVTPDVFAEQMAWLKENGYTTVRMDELARCLRAEAECPEQMVALTFDDGYDDAYTAALPILKRYGFSATFYIIPGLVGSGGYMTWNQVRELHKNGMEIGSHTVNHYDLTGLSLEEARVELTESRTILEREIAAPVLSFCYPIGSFNDELAVLVRDVGYTSAVTTQQMSQFSNLYELSRRRILGGDPVESLGWLMQPLE